MASKIFVSNFKTFRHNFWTNPMSRFLYEGRYYKFKNSDVKDVIFVNGKNGIDLIKIIIPRVWIKEYKKGLYLPVSEFSRDIKKDIFKYQKEKNKTLKNKLNPALVNKIKKYFVSKIAITSRQAKGLMKLQNIDLPPKDLHRAHKKLGF